MFFVIYDMEDNYLKECKNYKELTDFFKKSLNSMQSSYCRFKKGEINAIKSNEDNKLYKVYRYEKSSE